MSKSHKGKRKKKGKESILEFILLMVQTKLF